MRLGLWFGLVCSVVRDFQCQIRGVSGLQCWGKWHTALSGRLAPAAACTRVSPARQPAVRRPADACTAESLAARRRPCLC